MFTPQEIQEQTFSKAVFGGYDMQQVDELQPLVVGQEGRVSFHGLSFQYPNRSAARRIASTISTPNGHRGSHSPQPMHSEAWCASVR